MRDDITDNAQSRVGKTITNKYRLVRLVGCGGMAAVYEGVHRNGHRVAIKILHPLLSVEPELRARFLREGYAANKVGHRGAVRVIDDDMADDGSVFLVMELLEGETLDARLARRGERRGLPLAEVDELAVQLLEVMAAAHDAGIVHRDIKPENLFFTSDGMLKVLDFGIARLQDGGGPGGVTRTGHMMGTPAFMAPEQALGKSKQIDRQTDIWAIGATMFTLASGRYVHEAETPQEMLVRTASCPARSIRSVVPGAAAEVASVIDRALAFEKAERWSDARTMHAALVNAHRAAYGALLPGPRLGPGSEVDPYSQTVAASSDRDVPFSSATSRSTAGSVAPTMLATADMRAEYSSGQGPFAPAQTAAVVAQRAVSTTAGLTRTPEAREPEPTSPRWPRRLAASLAIAAIAAIAAGGVFVALHRNAAETHETNVQAAMSPQPLNAKPEAMSVPSSATSALKPAETVPTEPETSATRLHEARPQEARPQEARPGARQPPASHGSRATDANAEAMPSPSPTAASPTSREPASPSSSPPATTPEPGARLPLSPPSEPSPQAAPPAPKCRPVPYFDAEGNKRFRQECR